MITRASIEVMGTVASMAASDHRATSEEIARCFQDAADVLREMDQRFSHYKRDSAIARYEAGEPIAARDATDIEYVLDQCGTWEGITEGAFHARNPLTGALDTAGLVKALAIERAVEVMAQTCPDVLLNVGGDILARGAADPDRPWRTAIRGLNAPEQVHQIVDLRDQGIATSATYERGDHIWRREPGTASPGSVSVIGPSIVTADVLATASFAAGRERAQFLDAFPEYTVIWQ